jgi:hypothetical protein
MDAPDQQKRWVANSPLAQKISTILVKHPEYYDEVYAHGTLRRAVVLLTIANPSALRVDCLIQAEKRDAINGVLVPSFAETNTIALEGLSFGLPNQCH